MHGPFARQRLSGVKIPRAHPGSVKTAADECPAHACPRCRSPLTDPDGLGLCPRCNYCRSLAEVTIPAAGAPSAVEAAAPNIVASWHALGQLPASALPILVAALGLLPLCYVVDRGLPPVSFERAAWATAQLLLGVVTLGAAQVWAAVLLRRRGEAAGAFDVAFPGSLWSRALLALPETGGALSLALAGVIAVLTALLWIGGFWWWLGGDTVAVPAPRPAAAGRDWRDEYQRLKEATARVSGPTSVTPADQKPVVDAMIDTRPVTRCVVIGYQPNADGDITGLVLATLRDGQLTYAGTVSSGLGKDEAAALGKKLAALTRQTPLLDNLGVRAVWVRPELFCEVQQSGADAQGVLLEPRFKAVIED